MTITQDLTAATLAADNLSAEINGKINDIDNQLTALASDSATTVATTDVQVKRANTGTQHKSRVYLYILPGEDAGERVNTAYAQGAWHIDVSWDADGNDRNWNTRVTMPIGTTLFISGPDSAVVTLNGAVRAGRACYANGGRGGTSQLGSPMIFRNLEPATAEYPNSDYVKVWDSSELIMMSGNNTLFFGNGTYVFDQGGITANAYGNGLIAIEQHGYNMPNSVTGGSGACQFYLSGPLVNNRAGASTCEVKIIAGYMNKLSSDGPMLDVDKGFKRLLDKGVAGVTSDMLNLQPYEVTDVQAATNDNIKGAVSSFWFSETRGIDDEADRPRVIGATSWAYGSGWTLAQFYQGAQELSTHGMALMTGTNVYISVKE